MESTSLNALIGWYRNLPEEHQIDLAFIVLCAVPDYPLSDTLDTNRLPEEFIGWLENDNGIKVIGKIICARSLIDFFVIRKRATPDDWGRVSEFLKKTKSHQPRLVGTSDYLLERIPFREKQWIKTSESWRKLCESSLSDRELEADENQIMAHGDFL